ncbi:hypothetical protein NDA14_006315 [Ustilago hordei]|nr:hypothetical protein NDA14_006315 [Ustilago hordei]
MIKFLEPDSVAFDGMSGDTGKQEEEQCRRSQHQVMRRRSSVEGGDTTQEAQGCQAGEAPEQYSMKKVLSGERAGAASLVML